MIDTIANAIVAAVLPLRDGTPTPEKPLRAVMHWTGEFDSVEVISKAVLVQSPAAFIAFASMDVTSDPDEAAVDVTGRTEAIGELNFAVFVAVADTRDPNVALPSRTPAAVGAYACAWRVCSVLNNLFVAGTWQDQPIRVRKVSPYFVRAGVVYVLRVDVSVPVVLEDADVPTEFAGEPSALTSVIATQFRDGTYDDGTDAVPAEGVRLVYDAIDDPND